MGKKKSRAQESRHVGARRHSGDHEAWTEDNAATTPKLSLPRRQSSRERTRPSARENEHVTSPRGHGRKGIKTCIPRELVSERVLSDLHYTAQIADGRFLIDGALNRDQLREIFAKSIERRSRTKKPHDPATGSDYKQFTNILDDYVRERDFQFEQDLRRICWQSRVPPDLAAKLIHEHRAKQERKARLRRPIHANDVSLNAQLAQVIVIEDDEKLSDSDDTDDQVEEKESEAGDVVEKEDIASEDDDASTIDLQPSRVPKGRSELDLIVTDESRREGRGLGEWTQDRIELGSPPHAPSAPTQMEQQALTVIQQGHAEQRDGLLVSVLDMLREGFQDARSHQRSEQNLRKQILEEMREQENLCNTRQAERAREVERIRLQILESEKLRQDNEKRIREEAKKEVEADLARARSRLREEEAAIAAAIDKLRAEDKLREDKVRRTKAEAREDARREAFEEAHKRAERVAYEQNLRRETAQRVLAAAAVKEKVQAETASEVD